MAVDENKWYVRARGKVLGPFSWPQLEAMRGRGQLSRFHELSQDRLGWIPAGGLAGLFGAEDAPSGGRGQSPASAQGDAYALRDDVRSSSTTADADQPAWFHARGGASVGPFRLQDLRAQAGRGEIDGSTMVWREGMAGWVPSRDVPELASLSTSAPLPPSAHPGGVPAFGPPRTSGLAIASLVLGLVWLCGLGSLLAVIFGGVSLSQIARSRGSVEGKGMAIAGLVLGIIGLAFIVMFWLGVFGEMGRQEQLRRLRGF